MLSFSNSKYSKYILVNTGYTARIAERAIKDTGTVDFVHYTYQDLLDIKNGDLSKISADMQPNIKLINAMVEMEDEYEYYLELGDGNTFESHKPIFIEDTLWTSHKGAGYYIYKYVDLTEKINDILDIIGIIETYNLQVGDPNNEIRTGSVIFENTDRDYVEFLRKYKYCCLYGTPNFINVLGPLPITIIEIEAESG